MRKVSSEIDELDLLSAIWILVNNDENNLITYKGIIYRLNLRDNYDVRTLISNRPELFRLGANQDHIETWKQEMLRGRHLPSWIRAISPETNQNATIEAISSDDVFRSQFRSRKNAQRSEIEIIKWGLEHLDRLRKAKAEASDASVKRWQMWLVFWVSLAGVLSQFVIAFAKYKLWI